MAETPKPAHFKTRAEWRRWLERNHVSAAEIWLLYYKKHTSKPSVPYDDAVEEALCFGWIDGKVRTRDAETYIQRYTPRSDKSLWSKLNKTRAQRMIRAGLMTEAGLAKIRAAKRNGEWQKATRPSRPPRMPAELKAALAARPPALANFEAFAPSYRTQYLWWVASAKKPETRAGRIQKVVAAAAANRKPGMM
jgi:uncharacterized protein YdeI (YjbR/CyaY-like superfamily)